MPTPWTWGLVLGGDGQGWSEKYKPEGQGWGLSLENGVLCPEPKLRPFSLKTLPPGPFSQQRLFWLASLRRSAIFSVFGVGSQCGRGSLYCWVHPLMGSAYGPHTRAPLGQVIWIRSAETYKFFEDGSLQSQKQTPLCNPFAACFLGNHDWVTGSDAMLSTAVLRGSSKLGPPAFGCSMGADRAQRAKSHVIRSYAFHAGVWQCTSTTRKRWLVKVVGLCMPVLCSADVGSCHGSGLSEGRSAGILCLMGSPIPIPSVMTSQLRL